MLALLGLRRHAYDHPITVVLDDNPKPPLLRVRGLSVSYRGGVRALRDVSLDVPEASVVAVLGANGAGKTTLLRAVSGLLEWHRGQITHGSIEFGGAPVPDLDPVAMVGRGVSQVMEGRRLFADLTVEDNLAAAALRCRRQQAVAARRRVLELFPALAERLTSPAGSLSGGQQQMLAIGRALMSSPRLLLLDEPSMGLAPNLVEQLRSLIAGINAEGTTVLLVEQQAVGALSISHHGYVLENGAVRIHGPAAELRDHPEVRRSYLGHISGATGGATATVRAGTVPRAHDAPAEVEPSPLLEVGRLSLRFGAIVALRDVSFHTDRDEVLAIIGPNGAGKTSLLNCLNQVHRPETGSIRLDGVELVGLRPAEIAARGLARTFQNPASFPHLSVMDNLMLGRHHLMRSGLVAAALGWGRAKAEDADHRSRCEEIADQLLLQPYRARPLGTLPYGVQKRVELGRALAMEPKLLLLDEPSAGMSAAETDEVAHAIVRLRERGGPSIIVVEHDMGLVADVADRVVVLEFGRVISTGEPAAVQVNPEVVRAYLGTPVTAPPARAGAGLEPV